MNRWTVMSAVVLAAALLAPASAQKKPAAPPAHGAMPPGHGMNAGAKDPKVDKLKAEAAALDKQLKKKPKDAALRAKTAEAYYQAGYACEYSAVLGPHAKYAGALALYRRTLALNPKHAEATAKKNEIESIYRQMGMPIPKS